MKDLVVGRKVKAISPHCCYDTFDEFYAQSGLAKHCYIWDYNRLPSHRDVFTIVYTAIHPSRADRQLCIIANENKQCYIMDCNYDTLEVVNNE